MVANMSTEQGQTAFISLLYDIYKYPFVTEALAGVSGAIGTWFVCYIRDVKRKTKEEEIKQLKKEGIPFFSIEDVGTSGIYLEAKINRGSLQKVIGAVMNCFPEVEPRASYSVDDGVVQKQNQVTFVMNVDSNNVSSTQ